LKIATGPTTYMSRDMITATAKKGGEDAMLIESFDTFDELFRRFQPSFGDLFGRTGTGSNGQAQLFPPVEILRTDGELVIRMELPVDPDSVDVTLDDTTLRVRAERRVSTEEKGDFLRREFSYGIFERQVALPAGVDSEKMSARYDAGILEIRVPYAGAKAVKVPVETGSGKQEALKAAS
jgi:HSP20 family protein